ncbi:MAG: hypothetical protein KDE48_23435 [Anaerolineales bacterium]|nr:hypothetical protein [Anaerolineales bacterium]
MIETETRWEDSGFDCEHCGGEILLRTDIETGRADFQCYQCKECACQWLLSGDLHRIGDGAQCKKAAKASEAEGEVHWVDRLSRSLWILLAIIAGVMLLRFGGGLVIRLLLPLIALGVLGYVLVRYGRTQEWW